MRSITVCVDYADLLAITLPQNHAHFDHMLIVTSPSDAATAAVAESFPGVSVYRTDAFYRDGAIFNKGLAIEEAFDVLGRINWMCVLDADIVLPPGPIWQDLRPKCLTVPRRRDVKDRTRWADPGDWDQYPLLQEKEFAGYCQAFQAEDPALQCRPWYGIDWTHAGGCDSDFQNLWPAAARHRPPWEVLHLGDTYVNWCGRVQPYHEGDLPPDADCRRTEMSRLMRNRARTGHYGHEKVRKDRKG